MCLFSVQLPFFVVDKLICEQLCIRILNMMIVAIFFSYSEEAFPAAALCQDCCNDKSIASFLLQ